MEKSKVKHIFLETYLENWEDIFKLNQQFISRFIFRGQINENWSLSTSLERLVHRHYPNLSDNFISPLYEREMIKEFQWKYPLYSTNVIDHKNIIEWLAIMQHYGSATRFLDFSHSIFVAIYMAVAEICDNGVLWAVNKIPINFSIFEKYRKVKNTNRAGKDELRQFTIEEANNIILNHGFDKNLRKELYIIEPQFCNERLSRQQGLFLMPSDIKCSFANCLHTYLETNTSINISFAELIEYSKRNKYRQEDIMLMKIVIPKKLSFTILKYLRAMNVTSEILFPGMDGLAKSVNYQRIYFQEDE